MDRGAVVKRLGVGLVLAALLSACGADGAPEQPTRDADLGYGLGSPVVVRSGG